MFFSLVLAALPFFARSLTCTNDRSALLALYQSTNGASWFNKTNWNTNTSICSWYGVTCQSENNQTVVGLELNNNNLKGSIPAELGCLKNMKSLYLNDNDFSGSAIPSELFSGASSLQYLQLNQDSLNGPIPDTICGNPYLSYIYLDGNKFNSGIPCTTAKYPTYLREFHGSCSDLTGTLPDWFKNLKYITEVKVNCNSNFTCPAPASFPNIPILQCNKTNCDSSCSISPTQCPDYVEIENCGKYYPANSPVDPTDPDIPVIDTP